MSEQIIMTEEGFKKLSIELENLKTVKRAEIAEKIKVARGFGDLSENSEYDEAKNEQAITEARILMIEDQIKHVQIVSKDQISTDVVSVGSTVKIDDDGMELEYRIVSSVESESQDVPCITDKSPVGEALLGHKIGDTVEVHAPAGVFNIKIISISV